MPDNYKIVKEIRDMIRKAGINNTGEVIDIVERALKKMATNLRRDSGQR